MQQDKTKTTEPKRYFVPCPHCGHFHALDFWRIDFTATVRGKNVLAYYRCEKCDTPIYDEDKNNILAQGEWRGGGALHLNSLYSPWKSFMDVAQGFLDARNDPAELKQFINCWLAEPWIGSDGQPEVPDEPIELVWGSSGIRLSKDFTFEVADLAMFFTDEIARSSISSDR
ncbi:MAG: terminase gpA endonuclease subunit [Armatimonadota bacterium]|nr:phage terminase large subunit family protein [bacterium]